MLNIMLLSPWRTTENNILEYDTSDFQCIRKGLQKDGDHGTKLYVNHIEFMAVISPKLKRLKYLSDFY